MKKFWLFILGALLLGIVAFAATTELEPKTWIEVIQYALPLIPALAAAIIKGFKNWPELLTSKTFWGGVSGIILVVQQFFAGNIDPPTAAFGILVSLVAIFLRDAQATSAKASKEAAERSEAALNALARAGADQTRRK